MLASRSQACARVVSSARLVVCAAAQRPPVPELAHASAARMPSLSPFAHTRWRPHRLARALRRHQRHTASSCGTPQHRVARRDAGGLARGPPAMELTRRRAVSEPAPAAPPGNSGSRNSGPSTGTPSGLDGVPLPPRPTTQGSKVTQHLQDFSLISQLLFATTCFARAQTTKTWQTTSTKCWAGVRGEARQTHLFV